MEYYQYELADLSTPNHWKAGYNNNAYAPTIADSILSHPSERPDRALIFKEWFLNLSNESRFILGICWETPLDIVNWARRETHTPKNSKKFIERYLRKLGWEWEVIWSCFREIKTEIKNL